MPITLTVWRSIYFYTPISKKDYAVCILHTPAGQLANIKCYFEFSIPSKSDGGRDFKFFNFIFQLNRDYEAFTHSYKHSPNYLLSLLTGAVCISLTIISLRT
jgi:hypothetical protein